MPIVFSEKKELIGDIGTFSTFDQNHIYECPQQQELYDDYYEFSTFYLFIFLSMLNN
jgi:hypothetical protein